MSAGVSDQRMKGQGNQGMFGQPFGQQSSSNYYPNNGEYNNAWNTQQVNGPSGHSNQSSRKGGPPYDDYARGGNGYGGGSRGDGGIKSLEHGVQGMGLRRGPTSSDGKTANSSQPATKEASAPKKMTWATIASQPAKPQIRASSSTSTLKKKGPGMPPPPMVPGKHNIDGSWDSPKNGPVPTPVPVPSPPPMIEPSPLSQQATKNNNNNNNSNNANAANNNNANFPANNNGQQQQQQHHQNAAPHHQQPHPSQHPLSERGPNAPYNNQYRQDGPSNGPYGRDRDAGGPGGHRPNWHGPNQRDFDGGRMQHQQFRSGPGGPMNNYRGPPNQHYGGGNNQYRPHPRGSPPQHSSHLSQSPPPRGFHRPSGGSNEPGLASPPPQNEEIVSQVEKPVIAEPVVVEEILEKNNYNPDELSLDRFELARFFVIKSYSEDDIHRSIKYEIWCSTDHGNKRLDQAYREREKVDGSIYLFFSVNGSGHFCGVAQMISAVDYNSVSTVWHQDKWKGQFKVKWLYVKDVPNAQLRHIRLENNENKSVTNSRDVQEVPNPKGLQVLEIIHAFDHSTSIFDDFTHYEKRQLEEDTKKVDVPPPHGPPGGDRRGGYQQNNDRTGYQGGYDNRQSGYDNRRRDGQYGNNRGFHNFDNRRGDDYHQRGGGGGRGFDNPRDFRRDDRGYQGRDRFDRNDRFERGDRNIERGDRVIERGGDRNIERGDRIIERGDRNIERSDRNIERSDRIERRDRGADNDRAFEPNRDRPSGYRNEFQGNGNSDTRSPHPSDE